MKPKSSIISRSIPVWILLGAFLTVNADQNFDLHVMRKNVTGLFDVGDIDGDGKSDIVASGGSPALVWIHYPSLKEYVISQGNQFEMEVHVGDVDNDGDLDVLSPDIKDKKLVWFENPRPKGDPTKDTWKRHTIGTWKGDFPHDFKVGDINKDGKLDAVINVNAKSAYQLYIQQSPDVWTSRDVGQDDFEGTWLGDLDKDGDLDITDGKHWFECPPDPLTGEWKTYTFNNWSYAKRRTNMGDINKDGRLDIVTTTAEFGAGVLAWYEAPENPRTVPWKEHLLLPSKDYNFHTLQVGDIDRDGNLDIFVGSTPYLGQNGGYMFRIFYNTKAKGDAWEEQSWKGDVGNWQGILADVGSDGDLDIVSSNYDRNKSQWEFWENTSKATGILQINKLPILSLKRLPEGRADGRMMNTLKK